ncbi:hypothetical protein M8J77_003628 [Diaphorina citri]|nr:hypothetical protein M8J77_003628 [Diaphorina citri]
MLKEYFRLDENLPGLYAEWSNRDGFFRQTCGDFVGIRMLNQDLTENIFSFLCSSNNNIARISSMIDKMCKEYGTLICTLDSDGNLVGDCEKGRSNRTGAKNGLKTAANGLDKGRTKVCPEVTKFFAFPSIDALARPAVEAKLRQLGFGYRAKFIQKSAEYIIQGGGGSWLERLGGKSYEEAREELQRLPGIGAKVADCICLMSLSHLQAVPVDTHVYQIACNHYHFQKSTSKTLTPAVYNQIRAFFADKFGKYAGWAHSILFCADLKKFQAKPGEEKVGKRKSGTITETPGAKIEKSGKVIKAKPKIDEDKRKSGTIFDGKTGAVIKPKTEINEKCQAKKVNGTRYGRKVKIELGTEQNEINNKVKKRKSGTVIEIKGEVGEEEIPSKNVKDIENKVNKNLNKVVKRKSGIVCEVKTETDEECQRKKVKGIQNGSEVKMEVDDEIPNKKGKDIEDNGERRGKTSKTQSSSLIKNGESQTKRSQTKRSRRQKK